MFCFYQMTTLMSRTIYPTSNLYLEHVLKIQCLLELNMSSENNTVRKIISKMRKMFDKYMKQYNIILAMDDVFDPKIKIRI